MKELRAGIATADITPPIGSWMCGFGGRPKGCTGIHDPLLLHALVLDDGATALAIITADILSFSASMVAEIRQEISCRTPLAGRNVMLCGSHTHGGPALPHMKGMGEPDGQYLAALRTKAVSAVRQAWGTRGPAHLGFGRGAVRIGVNRRMMTDQGMKIGRNPDGPYDQSVHVLRVDDDTGRPVAVLFHHACHPVALGGGNLLLTADYPADARRTVEAMDGRPTAMFLQGCGGNINVDPRGSFEDARAAGLALGSQAAGIAAGIETGTEATLAVAIEMIALPLTIPPARHLARWLRRHEQALTAAEADSRQAGRLSYLSAEGRWLRRALELSRGTGTAPTQSFEIQVFRIGSAGLVALPAEVFVEIGQAIQADSPLAQAFVMGCANGCVGYLWPSAAAAEGGYEVDESVVCYDTLPFVPGAGEQVSQAAVALLADVRCR